MAQKEKEEEAEEEEEGKEEQGNVMSERLKTGETVFAESEGLLCLEHKVQEERQLMKDFKGRLKE